MADHSVQTEIFLHESKRGEDELAALATNLVPMLDGDEAFCLWLKAPLGAGKTTVTGHLLRALGLDSRIPVTSPTFTYMNEYETPSGWFAHLDLYRAGEAFSLEDLGLVDVRNFRGYFVEWPDNIPANPFLEPTHILEISFEKTLAKRRYKFAQCIA